MTVFEILIFKLTKIEDGYVEANFVANEIFSALKSSSLKELPNLTKKQMNNMKGLKDDKEELRKCVEEIASSRGLQGGRLQHIVTIYSQTQKEKIIDLQKSIIKKEEDTNTSLFRNQEFLTTLMATTEAVVDSAIYLNEQKNKDGHMFLHKKI